MLPPKKTLRRHDVPGTARFLTFSCYRRLPLFRNDAIKDRCVEHLTRIVVRHRVEVFAWVVMPEHLHMVVRSESTPVATLLLAFKRTFAAEVLARWRQLKANVLPALRDRRGDVHFWQAGGGYDRNVVGGELLEKVAYCHRNPVSRGLCDASVDWRWSSARAYEHRSNVIGPTIAFHLLPSTDRRLT